MVPSILIENMKQLILISSPISFPNEADIINALFREGLSLFHLRKPDTAPDELMKLIESIEPQYREHIVLPATFLKHKIAGQTISKQIHFFEYARKEAAPSLFVELKEQGYTLSTSIHEAATYASLPAVLDYTFIGPVYNSISKQGYNAMDRAHFEVLQQKKNTAIIALGGIDENNCLEVLDYGFDGIAILGAVWQNKQPLETFNKIRTCIMTGR